MPAILRLLMVVAVLAPVVLAAPMPQEQSESQKTVGKADGQGANGTTAAKKPPGVRTCLKMRIEVNALIVPGADQQAVMQSLDAFGDCAGPLAKRNKSLIDCGKHDLVAAELQPGQTRLADILKNDKQKNCPEGKPSNISADGKSATEKKDQAASGSSKPVQEQQPKKAPSVRTCLKLRNEINAQIVPGADQRVVTQSLEAFGDCASPLAQRNKSLIDCGKHDLIAAELQPQQTRLADILKNDRQKNCPEAKPSAAVVAADGQTSTKDQASDAKAGQEQQPQQKEAGETKKAPGVRTCLTLRNEINAQIVPGADQHAVLKSLETFSDCAEPLAKRNKSLIDCGKHDLVSAELRADQTRLADVLQNDKQKNCPEQAQQKNAGETKKVPGARTCLKLRNEINAQIVPGSDQRAILQSLEAFSDCVEPLAKRNKSLIDCGKHDLVSAELRADQTRLADVLKNDKQKNCPEKAQQQQQQNSGETKKAPGARTCLKLRTELNAQIVPGSDQRAILQSLEAFSDCAEPLAQRQQSLFDCGKHDLVSGELRPDQTRLAGIIKNDKEKNCAAPAAGNVQAPAKELTPPAP